MRLGTLAIARLASLSTSCGSDVLRSFTARARGDCFLAAPPVAPTPGCRVLGGPSPLRPPTAEASHAASRGAAYRSAASIGERENTPLQSLLLLPSARPLARHARHLSSIGTMGVTQRFVCIHRSAPRIVLCSAVAFSDFANECHGIRCRLRLKGTACALTQMAASWRRLCGGRCTFPASAPACAEACSWPAGHAVCIRCACDVHISDQYARAGSSRALARASRSHLLCGGTWPQAACRHTTSPLMR